MSLNKLKTDSELGIKVLDYLKEKKVHTPGSFLNQDGSLQIIEIEKHLH